MKEKRRKAINFQAFIVAAVIIASCGNPAEEHSDEQMEANQLPYYGMHGDPTVNTPMPGEIEDSLIYTVPKWSLVNQNNKRISHREYEGKIYVTDFFFTTCPSICPVMSSQMDRLQEKVQKEGLQDEVMFLSHTVNPENDTPEKLHEYAEELGADTTNWNFVTGNREDIYYLAKDGYFINALPADSAPGGFIHSDNFMLIDSKRHIRGYYDGTSTESVDELFEDLENLVKAKK